MDMRTRGTILGVVVGLCVIVGVGVCSAESAIPAGTELDRVLESPSGFTLDACIEHALEEAPGVGAARHEWLATRAAVGRVGSLPDPTLTYGHFVDAVETRVGPQEQKLALRQTLPWFGKLRLRSEAARAGAGVAYQLYRRAAADAVFEVTEAFVEYANLRTTIEILERRATLLEDLENVARERYASGDVPYADLMRAGIERARISDRLAAARARRSPASARLAAALGATRDEPLPWPEGLPGVVAREADDATAALSLMSPELLALDGRIEEAERLKSLARRGYFPDLTVGVDYIVTGEAAMPVDESGKDPLVVSASVNIPLWFGKHAGAISERTERIISARDMRRHKANETDALLKAALFEIEDATRRVALYEGEIVPSAEQSLASARAAYGNGAIGFEGVVAAEQYLLEFELSLARARADAVVAASRLERLLGNPVEVRPPEGE